MRVSSDQSNMMHKRTRTEEPAESSSKKMMDSGGLRSWMQSVEAGMAATCGRCDRMERLFDGLERTVDHNVSALHARIDGHPAAAGAVRNARCRAAIGQ